MTRDEDGNIEKKDYTGVVMGVVGVCVVLLFVALGWSSRNNKVKSSK